MECQHVDIIEVRALGDYKLFLRFEDGMEGIVDISNLIEFKGIFSKLKDKQYFASVTVNPDIGTICWGNGADLAPSFLYNEIKQQRNSS